MSPETPQQHSLKPLKTRRWSEVKALIKDEEAYLAMEGDDKYRLSAFDDFMAGLARKEAEEREIEREKKRAAEKDQRAAFAVLLGELRDMVPPLVNAKTTWKELEALPQAAEDERMIKLLAEQSKGRALDVFEDFVVDLNKKYQAVRP